MKKGFFAALVLSSLAFAGCASHTPEPEPAAPAVVLPVAPNCHVIGDQARCQWIEPPAPARVPGVWI